MIMILKIIFNINKLKEVRGRYKNIREIAPTKLPKSNLFKKTTLFNILLVPYRSIKSKKKLIKKTRSKYTFMISPRLIYKIKSDYYVALLD